MLDSVLCSFCGLFSPRNKEEGIQPGESCWVLARPSYNSLFDRTKIIELPAEDIEFSENQKVWSIQLAVTTINKALLKNKTDQYKPFKRFSPEGFLRNIIKDDEIVAVFADEDSLIVKREELIKKGDLPVDLIKNGEMIIKLGVSARIFSEMVLNSGVDANPCSLHTMSIDVANGQEPDEKLDFELQPSKFPVLRLKKAIKRFQENSILTKKDANAYITRMEQRSTPSIPLEYSGESASGDPIETAVSGAIYSPSPFG